MSGSTTKILKETDFNKDGFLDRVTAQCSRNEKGDDVCQDYQVEMGLKKGGFVDLFDREVLGEKTEFKKRTKVVYSPKYYAQNPFAAIPPGTQIPNRVRMGHSSPNPLKTEQLFDKDAVDKCEKNSPEGKIECMQSAIVDPDDIPQTFFMMQDQELKPYVLPENSALVYFEKLKDPENVPPPPIAPEFLAGAKAVVPHIFAPEEFGRQLKANLFQNVQDKTSKVFGEYLYALKQKAISKDFMVEAVLADWDHFSEQVFASPEGQKIILKVCGQESPEHGDMRVTLTFALIADFTKKQGPIAFQAGLMLFDLTPKEWAKEFFTTVLEPGAKVTLQDDPLLKKPEASTALRDIALWILAARAPESADPRALMASLENSYLVGRMTMSENNLKPLEQRMLTYIAALENASQVSPAVLLNLWSWLEERIHKSPSVPFFSLDTGNKIARMIEKQVNKPENLTSIVRYLSTVGTNGFYEDFYNFQPILEGMLLNVQDPKKIPPAKDLIRLAEVFVGLRGPALFAIAKRGEECPEAMALVDSLAKSQMPNQRLMAIKSAPILLGKKAIPFLISFTKEKNDETRLAAYYSLSFFGVEEKQVVESFIKALDDPSAAVQVFAAQQLIGRNVPEVAAILFQKLKNYVEDPMYPARKNDKSLAVKKFDIETMATTAFRAQREDFLQRNRMETVVSLKNPDGSEGKPMTLKQLTIDAMLRFRQPLVDEAPLLLAKLLMDDSNATDLQLESGALARFVGPNALGPIFERIETKRSPESLYQIAIEIVQEAKVVKALPMIYQFVMHNRPAVRKAALFCVLQLGQEKYYQLILNDSAHPKPMVRKRMAEALGYCEDKRAVQRLIEMTHDSNVVVQKQALAALSNYTNPQMKLLIDQEKTKNSGFKAKLEDYLALATDLSQESD